ncbi:hypothetical protein LTS16_017507 [Friedmanniomyces endolithicus]|nr:hypothetical protein LTR38_000097 [Friedmanniomyces endolithicus]KAK1032072.1 hypothetical protein LTS16_017507 [Friedmanniomyces endolithicus]
MAEGNSKPWLILGASRGIGHEFAAQLLNRGDDVFVTVRKPGKEHDVAYWTDAKVEASHCTTLECDVLSEKSIDVGLTLAAQRSSYDDLAYHLHTNTIGPILAAQKLLKAGIPIGTIVFISSDSGSVSAFREHEDGFAAYGASKAALNVMARHMATELKRKGSRTTILMLHPGEVSTDMAKIEGLAWEVEGQMEPAESVAACIKTIESKGPSDSGTFWTWHNESTLERFTNRRRVEHCRRAQANVLIVKFDAKSFDILKE